MITLDDSDCLHFDRNVVCPSWPVKVEGMRGLWRYIKPLDHDGAWVYAEVIGPYFPNNPSRNGGRSRIFTIASLKYAGRKAKPADVTDLNTIAVSETAKRAQRRSD